MKLVDFFCLTCEQEFARQCPYVRWTKEYRHCPGCVAAGTRSRIAFFQRISGDFQEHVEKLEAKLDTVIRYTQNFELCQTCPMHSKCLTLSVQ